MIEGDDLQVIAAGVEVFIPFCADVEDVGEGIRISRLCGLAYAEVEVDNGANAGSSQLTVGTERLRAPVMLSVKLF